MMDRGPRIGSLEANIAHADYKLRSKKAWSNDWSDRTCKKRRHWNELAPSGFALG